MACAVLVIRVKRQEFTREGAEARRREELAAAAKPLSLRRPGVWRNLADRERLRREHAGFAASRLRVRLFWPNVRQPGRRRQAVRSVSELSALEISYKKLYIVRMQTLSVSETRANLKAVLDRVVADKAPIQITRPKGEGVVMIAQSEWDGMQETMHLLSSPRNAERLLEAIRGLEAGEGVEHALIEP